MACERNRPFTKGWDRYSPPPVYDVVAFSMEVRMGRNSFSKNTKPFVLGSRTHS